MFPDVEKRSAVRRRLLPLLLAMPFLLAMTPPALGQERTVTIVPGARYDAGGLHRTLFGAGYRDLWATPIEVPVLDLDALAGGLEVLRIGGFGQTRSLHLQGADGRRYVFRSVDKDVVRGLPSVLQGTFVDNIVQDQISALHPDAALIVPPIMEAGGVLHVVPTLYVMPDDPRLGEHREEFAGLLGLLEERPDEGDDENLGLGGSRRIVSTENLFERMEESPEHRVDSRNFLAARLLDLLVGDRDRHTDQWRWARFEREGGYWWRPIPRDRDQAFIEYGGLMMSVVRAFTPQFVPFSTRNASLTWATWNGRELDRRLLTELEKSEWMEIARTLQSRLPDSLIEGAVRRIPSEHHAISGAALVENLKQRRDGLVDLAEAFYLHLARQVDIHATDADEVVTVDRLPGGSVEIRIAAAEPGTDEGSGEPYFHRRFDPSETREIRLLMHGGDDRVQIGGEAEESILLHVVGGGGDDDLRDESLIKRGGQRTRLYDSRGENRIEGGQRTLVDRSEPFRDPRREGFGPAPLTSSATALHERNWGSWWRPAVWIEFESDVGLFLGGGAVLYKYGFRKAPWAYRMVMRGGYALEELRPRFEYRLEFPHITPDLRCHVQVRASEIEVVNFYGFGNETADTDVADEVRVRQEQFLFAPTFTLASGEDTGLYLGPVVKHSHTRRNPGSRLSQLQPYGSTRDFGQIGMLAGVQVDTRDNPAYPTRGAFLTLDGTWYAGAWTPSEPFGSLAADIRTFVTPLGTNGPTLALRGAARKIWGDFPYFESAFIGGSSTVRGFRNERFAGDGAVWGGTEIRQPLGTINLLVPSEIGILGLADAGRVYLVGEDSNEWHVSAGGGVFISLLRRQTTVSFTVASGPEGTGVYFHSGFMF